MTNVKTPEVKIVIEAESDGNAQQVSSSEHCVVIQQSPENTPENLPQNVPKNLPQYLPKSTEN